VTKHQRNAASTAVIDKNIDFGRLTLKAEKACLRGVETSWLAYLASRHDAAFRSYGREAAASELRKQSIWMSRLRG
jgi:hypothetical protein